VLATAVHLQRGAPAAAAQDGLGRRLVERQVGEMISDVRWIRRTLEKGELP
jgi:hypothetical protein